MAVTSLKKIAGKSGQGDLESSQYVDVYRVLTDDKEDGQGVVVAALPAAGSQHPDSPIHLLREFDFDQDEDAPKKWTVTLTYWFEPGELDDGDATSNTDSQGNDLVVANAELRSSRIQVPIWKESDQGDGSPQRAIKNSAGDYFDPPPQREESRMTLVITLNLATIPAYVIDYQDAVNDAAVTFGGMSFATDTLKSTFNVGPEQERSGIRYRTITIECDHKPDTWYGQYLDQGFRTVDSNLDQRQAYTESDGAQLSQPILLDGNGAALPNPSVDNGVFYPADGERYKLYKRKAFAGTLPGFV